VIEPDQWTGRHRRAGHHWRLEDEHFEDHVRRGEPELHHRLEFLIALLVPVVFGRTGMLVDTPAAGKRRG
jgi:hypothetical protein